MYRRLSAGVKASECRADGEHESVEKAISSPVFHNPFPPI